MVYPANLNLEILQGATFYRRFVWRTGANKTPVDLTGAEIRMQVRYAPQVDDVLLELSTLDGTIEVEDALAGTFALRLTPEITNEISFTSARYDLEVELPSTGTHRLINGKVSVNLQVTR